MVGCFGGKVDIHHTHARAQAHTHNQEEVWPGVIMSNPINHLKLKYKRRKEGGKKGGERRKEGWNKKEERKEKLKKLGEKERKRGKK